MKDFAIIFDMDGVIVDNHQYHLKAWLTFLEKHGIQMSEEEYKQQVNGRPMAEVIQKLFDGDMSPQEARALGEEKEEMYRDLYRKNISPTAGLKQFLDTLNQYDIPRAVGTSAPTANVKFTMENTGLTHYFPLIVDDTMFEKGKPDPEVYLTAAKKLNISPERCIVFEDAMLGIQAGKNAGMKVIGVATTHTHKELEEADTDLVIDNFENLNLEQLKTLIKP